MNEEIDVTQESSPEEVVEEEPTDEVEETTPEEPVVSEDEKTPAPEAPPKKAEDKSVPYERFKEVNDELAKLKSQKPKEVNKSLEVDDFIDISASLDGLDQREKEYLAQQHKLSGRPLKELRTDEDFSLWQSAYRAKVEKEKKSLDPSSTQSVTPKPKSFVDSLKSAQTLGEKEEMLIKAGLYKPPKGNANRTQIGGEKS